MYTFRVVLLLIGALTIVAFTVDAESTNRRAYGHCRLHTSLDDLSDIVVHNLECVGKDSTVIISLCNHNSILLELGHYNRSDHVSFEGDLVKLRYRRDKCPTIEADLPHSDSITVQDVDMIAAILHDITRTDKKIVYSIGPHRTVFERGKLRNLRRAVKDHERRCGSLWNTSEPFDVTANLKNRLSNLR